jgi:hypothetical protein
MVWRLVGVSEEDLDIAEIGAQTVEKNLKIKDDGRRILHDLHAVANHHLSGNPLEVITNRFIDTLCDDIDKRFPPREHGSYEWETLDLCEFVKHVWTHASITALYGSHIYSVWPGIETWLWDFDQRFQQIIKGVPRFMAPKAYTLRDEGNKMFQLWESEATKAENEGKIGNDPDWDTYWGLRYARAIVDILIKQGISPQGRGGLMMATMWAVSHPHVTE